MKFNSIELNTTTVGDSLLCGPLNKQLISRGNSICLFVYPAQTTGYLTLGIWFQFTRMLSNTVKPPHEKWDTNNEFPVKNPNKWENSFIRWVPKHALLGDCISPQRLKTSILHLLHIYHTMIRGLQIEVVTFSSRMCVCIWVRKILNFKCYVDVWTKCTVCWLIPAFQRD